MVTLHTKQLLSPRKLLGVVICVLLVYTILSQVGDIGRSLRYLRDSNTLFLVVAVLLTAITYLFAAKTYQILAYRPLAFSRTVLVQLAAMCINRLLPSGVGAVGANFLYLKQNRHSTSQAAAVVSANNLLGLLGHVLIIIPSLILFGRMLSPVSVPRVSNNLLITAVVVLVGVAVGLLAMPKIRSKIRVFITSLSAQLVELISQPLKISLALCSSMSLTIANIAALYFCLLALNISLSFPAVVLAFSLGIALGTAIPTPGGLGGVEAGIVAGLIAYGVQTDVAIAAVIAFRLISYWLAFIVGIFALLIVQRRHYLG